MFTLQEGHEMKQKNKRTKEVKKKYFNEVIIRKWTTDELIELGRS